ncbi:DinB family protein [Paenibacillus pasadenensis]|uniref:Damage-inducible protein DinB n=1 Tax=Paenibacillus pasadenensis TaxID=217090 RepID=A0A2N5N275_9BACL|nr:DinB family protein [Paenibacillus pasadenensis]PLT44429.1 hypothetical protein B8V81_2860 [Paenibacillus pasadenensis]
MQVWFKYNWIVRDQWYEWCAQLPEEELVRERIGGMGSILKTLQHILDVEWSWIQQLREADFASEPVPWLATLAEVRELDRQYRSDIEPFILGWDDSMETRPMEDVASDGHVEQHAWGEVMRHVLAHEIHHIGQLSIWARELGLKPVSANLIGKGLIPIR